MIPQDLSPLPRHDPDSMEKAQPLATACWLPSSSVLKAIKASANDKPRNPIILGQLWERGESNIFFTDDDRHVITIAGSRAGKRRSLIIPNLLSYPGSVVCIDPKGENAAVTALYRKEILKQKVIILDPFEVLNKVEKLAELRGSFNPFEWISLHDKEAIDDVNALADAIIVRDNPQDPHWNESARIFLKGVMLTVMALLPTYDQNEATGEVENVNWTLGAVRQIASLGIPHPETPSGEPSLEGLLAIMKSIEEFDGAVAAAGHLLEQMGDKERGGVLSNLRRHTEFLESPAISQNVVDSDFNPKLIKSEPTTIYLVLPEWRMGTHSRWLRLVITSILHGLQRSPTLSNIPATLLILDEFATLGHMESIERAAGYIAGFGVKIWTILQDLNQIKSLYSSRWETFLGNAGTLLAFGNIDVTTLEYLSRRLGETEIIRSLTHTSYQEGSGDSSSGIGQTMSEFARGRIPAGFFGSETESSNKSFSSSEQQTLQKAALITPDEIARYFSRESEVLLVHLAGHQPFRLNRIRYDLDRPFCKLAAKSPYH